MAQPDGASATPWWRRRRTAVASGVVLVVAVGLVVLNVLVLRYQPIQSGIYGEHRGGRSVDPFDAPAGMVEIIDSDAFEVFAVRARPGRSFTIGFDVVNDGGRGVRIAEPPSVVDSTAVELVSVTVDDDVVARERGGTPRRWQPFSPFMLEGHDRRYFRFKYRFAACDPSVGRREFAVFESPRVEFEVMGISRSTRIYQSTSVVIETRREWCDSEE